MTDLNEAVDVAFLEIAGEADPHDPVVLANASLAVQTSVELPFGKEKITAFKVAQTAADIAEVWASYPEDFND